MIEILLQAERTLTMGMLDQAEHLYRQVAAADPQNAMAVVGLARVALERGDERGAWSLAVRALAIDPEDTAAERLEARLAEVLATRGDPVERPAWVEENERRWRGLGAAELATAAATAPKPLPPTADFGPPEPLPVTSAAPGKRGFVARLVGLLGRFAQSGRR
jgi:thioredoxin-like negative regulator of GroEL